MSDLEDTLEWQMRVAGLPPFEREYRFMRGRRYRFDFAWPAFRLACEAEGGRWTGGRHVRPAGYEADCVKYSEAAILGWRVIRVTDTMIHDGRALDLVMRALGAS